MISGFYRSANAELRELLTEFVRTLSDDEVAFLLSSPAALVERAKAFIRDEAPPKAGGAT